MHDNNVSDDKEGIWWPALYAIVTPTKPEMRNKGSPRTTLHPRNQKTRIIDKRHLQFVYEDPHRVTTWMHFRRLLARLWNRLKSCSYVTSSTSSTSLTFSSLGTTSVWMTYARWYKKGILLEAHGERRVWHCEELPNMRPKWATGWAPTPLRLFPASGPLEVLAVDILGPLPECVHENRYVLVMTNCYSKLKGSGPSFKNTPLHKAYLLMDNWTVQCGISTHVFAENGTNFINKLFKSLYIHLGTEHFAPTPHHLQTINGVTI